MLPKEPETNPVFCITDIVVTPNFSTLGVLLPYRKLIVHFCRHASQDAFDLSGVQFLRFSQGVIIWSQDRDVFKPFFCPGMEVAL